MTSADALLLSLRSDDPRDRQRAAMQLGTTDPSPVMPELVALMAAEPDDFVRETLIWAVVSRPAAAAPALVAALESPGLPHEPVLHALSKVGDPATVSAVLPFTSDPDPRVAAKAWWVLGRVGKAECLPPLLAHLGEGDADQREALTRALLQVGQPAVEPLGDALTSDDPERRLHAALTLVRLADPEQYAIDSRADADWAADALRRSTAGEVDEALLLASADQGRPGLAAVAARLRAERA